MKIQLICPYCENTTFVVGKTNKTYGGVGKSMNFPNQPICHDICEQCGSVVRTYVEHPEKLK
ncbi:hypothetical protein EII38_04120 [Streptococcus minor]|uniref:Uncharacterized protein n=1 Tax=Streptococcus minor TaxID=229549 RepID=A0A3P1VE81_9STRE|nr:hypothetical protein [Streptococcus minor]RRD31946.1 hypothetical protein EII38_04120 [Streptococcus minor]